MAQHDNSYELESSSSCSSHSDTSDSVHTEFSDVNSESTISDGKKK